MNEEFSYGMKQAMTLTLGDKVLTIRQVGGMSQALMRDSKTVREAVIAAYRAGNKAAEILSSKERLAESHPLGEAWLSLNQFTVSRWLNQARKADWPDLEIRHLLNLRATRPGYYTVTLPFPPTPHAYPRHT